MNRVEAHDVHITGSGPDTLIFAHGIGGNQRHWRALVEHFSTRYQVVTFDLAGVAGADPTLWSPERHRSILGYADDLGALCADLGIRGATYVGHSMSGMAGVLAAAADPGIFDRLILLSASARYVDDPAAGYVGGFSADEMHVLLETMEADFALWAAGFAPIAMKNEHRPEYASEFAANLATYRPDIGLASFRAAFTSDFRAYLPRVSVPTLVIQNPDDPAVPMSAATYLVEHLQNAQLTQIAAEGHFPHVVAPAEVAAAMDSFLQDP